MYLGNKRLFWVYTSRHFGITDNKLSLAMTAQYRKLFNSDFFLYKPLRLTPEKENEMTCRPRWHFGHRCSRILYLHIFIYLFWDQPILKFLLKTNIVWICLYNITIFKEKHGYEIRLASSLTISIKKRNRAHLFCNSCR